jgi:hypothetical protein
MASIHRRRGSAVSMFTRPANPGFKFRRQQDIYLFPQNVRTGSWAHSALWVAGTHSLVGKAAGTWGYHSPPRSAEVRKRWKTNTTPLSLHAFVVWTGTNLPFFAASFHIPPKSLIISEPRNPTKLYKIQSLPHTMRPHYANNPMIVIQGSIFLYCKTHTKHTACNLH